MWPLPLRGMFVAWMFIEMLFWWTPPFRKYCILDDCSRLRDIIKALPATRWYIPSLLIICWTEGEESHAASNFFSMVSFFCLIHSWHFHKLFNQAKKLVEDSILQSYHVFSLTTATKNLDNKLGGRLGLLDLDLEGKLVQTLGVFKLFKPMLKSFLSEWIENCSTNGTCE